MYGFEDIQNMTGEQILNLLTQYDKNIRMKTVNISPLEMSALDAYTLRLKDLKLKKSHAFVSKLIEYLDQRMCSRNGDRAVRIINAIAEARNNTNQNRTILDRLLGRNKESL